LLEPLGLIRNWFTDFVGWPIVRLLFFGPGRAGTGMLGLGLVPPSTSPPVRFFGTVDLLLTLINGLVFWAGAGLEGKGLAGATLILLTGPAWGLAGAGFEGPSGLGLVLTPTGLGLAFCLARFGAGLAGFWFADEGIRASMFS
jgi:hypothetical protein